MTLALVLLLAAAPDAPLDPDAPGRALVIEAGELVPFRAACLDEQEDVRRARRLVRAETKLEEYEKDLIIPKPAFVAIVIGVAAVVGGATALAFTLAAKK